MKVNIRSLIKKLSNRTNLFSVLNEAVVNSIQAGATKIEVEFFRDSEQSELLNDKPKINAVHISDNGEGFNQKNRESFSEYATENKISEGCKGIGRLCYLKVFEDISIESFIKDDFKKVICNFTENFTYTDFKVLEDKNIISNKTTIKLHQAKPNYSKGYDISEIKNRLFLHILPILYLNATRSITVEMKDATEEQPSYIRTSDLPDFQKKDFTIKEHVTNDKTEIAFTLHYAIADSDEDKVLDFYCGNKRTVCRFKDKELKIIPIKCKSAIFLVTSPFLDKAVNDERDDFDIFPKNTDLLRSLSWEQINNHLKEALRDVIYEAYPNLQEDNAKTIAAIRDESLHLADYMGEIDSLGGLIDSESIIEKAEQLFQQDKKSFRAILKSQRPNNEEVLRRASDLAGKELIEYVITRDKIISQFESMDLKKEENEEILRNHFLKRGLSGDSYSPVAVKENNLWLLDDKFMTYSYVASEQAIKTLLKKAGLPELSSADRFDIGIYSNSDMGKRAIMVEFKKLSAGYKENGVGIDQLYNYASQLKQSGVEQIYLYLIAEVDDKFRTMLTGSNRGFNRVFSQEGELYQRSYDDVNAYIQIVSPKALIADARARNKTFIDMIRVMTTKADN
jgi:hypothetical protein